MIRIALSLLLAVLLSDQAAFAHCQIPCGIYDDEMRIQQVREHIDTIEKSMTSIVDLSGHETKDYNQIVRWVENKDEHAEFIEEIVSYYFLAQRIKPVEDKKADGYARQVELLHSMLIYTMKAKQSTDLAFVEKLRGLVDEFEKSYFEPKKEG